MTPRQLQAFTALAQTLSFARAGERLHMSQPALSLAIRNLEEAFGGLLFSRTTRQVELTPEGAALLPQALQLLADWNSLQENARRRFSLQRGHVTIAAMPSFAANLLPRVLGEYRERFPNVDVSVNDVINEQVMDMVASGEVEFGCAFEPEGKSTLSFEPLFTDRFIAIVAPGSELAATGSVSWAQLLRQNFITLQRPSSMRRRLEEALRAEGMELHVALESHQLATVSQLVAAGLGVSVVPSLLAAQASRLGAKCLEVEHPVVLQRVGIITRGDHSLSSPAIALKAVMQAAFAVAAEADASAGGAAAATAD